MLTLNFHSIVKEIFKNSKGVYAYEYSFKPKKPETSFIVPSFLSYSESLAKLKLLCLKLFIYKLPK